MSTDSFSEGVQTGTGSRPFSPITQLIIDSVLCVFLVINQNKTKKEE